MNLVPGATPPAVPERADGHARPRAHHEHQRDEPQQQRHADRRRRQHQRVAAASRRVHCAGRDHRERQHLDQQLRCGPGHDRRRGHGGRDQVGHQHLQGLGVLLPPAGRVQRPPRVFRPEQGRCEHRHHGRDGRRSGPPQPSLLLRIVGTQRRAPGHFQHLHRADRADAQRRFRRGARAESGLPDLRSRHGHVDRRGTERSSRTR